MYVMMGFDVLLLEFPLELLDELPHPPQPQLGVILERLSRAGVADHVDAIVITGDSFAAQWTFRRSPTQARTPHVAEDLLQVAVIVGLFAIFRSIKKFLLLLCCTKILVAYANLYVF
jgi:hypothetical protein